MNKEPLRQNGMAGLNPIFRLRLNKLLDAMKARGFDATVFETIRTHERQEYLYNIGRTPETRDRKPITWTKDSKHILGKAADIISKSKGWSWAEFYVALREEAVKVGLKTLRSEACHCEL